MIISDHYLEKIKFALPPSIKRPVPSPNFGISTPGANSKIYDTLSRFKKC